MRANPCRRLIRWRNLALAGALAFTAAATTVPASAEVAELRIAQQFGLPYLPLIVACNRHLIEQEAAAAGLGTVKVIWVRLGGGAAVDDALLTGSIEFGAAGVPPLLSLWDKTRGKLGVRGVVALDASALYLNVNRPEIRTLADLGDRDRIGLPAVKVSQQAVLLEMAAAQRFGFGHYDRFDRLTVTMAHPDAYAALLTGRTEITGHFGNSPYIYQELANPRIHRLLSSEDVVGGLGTVTSLFTTAKVHDDNPKLYRAVVAALRKAQALIASDKALAASIYVAEEPGGLKAAAVARILDLPSTRYSIAPINTEKVADFLYRIGMLHTKPGSWHDYFFPEIDDLSGS